MATGLSPAPSLQTVDLTGLSEPVAQGVRQLVRALRDGQRESSRATSMRPEELERLLDEFAGGKSGKILPPDFSRADIYDDHD